MSSIVPTKELNKPVLNKLQKTFNTLKKKIQQLQNRLEETNTTLKQALCFFQKEITPLECSLLDTVSDFIKILYHKYKNPKHLSKREQSLLKELIIDKCYGLIDLSDSIDDIDMEVHDIFKDLNGMSYNEVLTADLENGKAMLSAMFDDLNIDVDLSSLDPSDSEETILRKVLESAIEARRNQEAETPPPTKQKSKKELQKELKAEELKKLQQEGLGRIYKGLAKAIHPDLEQDQTIKNEKEQIMKRLTTAYENDDLYTLLSIEMEWLNSTESDEKEKKLQSDEQLKIFNSLLNDQIKELEAAIRMAPLHPDFFLIQRFNFENISSVFPQLRSLRNAIKSDISDFKEVIEGLTSPKANEILRSILHELV